MLLLKMRDNRRLWGAAKAARFSASCQGGEKPVIGNRRRSQVPCGGLATVSPQGAAEAVGVFAWLRPRFNHGVLYECAGIAHGICAGCVGIAHDPKET